jgi:hypothetical protein
MIGLWPALRFAYPSLRTVPERPSIAWNTTQSAAGLWVLSPLLTIALCFGASFSPPPGNVSAVRLGIGELALPFAAWIGSQYGQSGFRLLAVIFLPILIGMRQDLFDGLYSVGLAGPSLGTYVAALVICRFFGEQRYREACLRADRIDATALILVCFTLLAMFRSLSTLIGLWASLALLCCSRPTSPIIGGCSSS